MISQQRDCRNILYSFGANKKYKINKQVFFDSKFDENFFFTKSMGKSIYGSEIINILFPQIIF